MLHRSSTLGAAALAATLILVSGCDDADVTAPADGSLVVTVSPSTITIDPNDADAERDTLTGHRKGESTVLARVFDAEGLPLQNVAVIFSATAGRFIADCDGPEVPIGNSVSTDASGVAEVCLIVTENDPEDIAVTAQSSALSDEAVITKSLVGENERPRAAIIALPATQAAVNTDVVFDASQSIDTDGTITMYRWVITSDDPGTPTEIVESPNALGLTRRYTSAQELTVTLEVTDDPAAPALLAAGQPVPYDDFDVIKYPIVDSVCENSEPTASAGPDQAVSFLSNPTDVVVDGTNSFDQDGRIERYNFSCGNGTEPQNADSTVTGIAVCRYNQAGTYTITLTVRDNGNGVLGNNGEFECVAFDEDTATVTLTRPQ